MIKIVLITDKALSKTKSKWKILLILTKQKEKT